LTVLIGNQPLETGMDRAEADTCTLSDLIRAEAPLAIERAISLAISICDAVEDHHRQGYFSGSLNPQDILLATSHGNLAVKIRVGAQPPFQRDGNLQVLAPRLAPEAADQIDAASDVYCIGTILFEMLIGSPPFQDHSAEALIIRQILESPHPPRDLRPDIPDRLNFILLRALEREKSRRQQTIVRLRQELASVLTEMRKDTNITTGAGFIAGPAPELTASEITLGAPMARAAIPLSKPSSLRLGLLGWVVGLILVGGLILLIGGSFVWLSTNRAGSPAAMPEPGPVPGPVPIPQT
jgi:serine/threonine-protein kinase